MQRLYVASDLDVDPVTAWRLFDSEAFRLRLDARARLHTRIVDEQRDGAVVRRTLRVRSLTELPHVAARALGSRHVTYDMSTRFDPGLSRLDWSIRLPVLTDRVLVAGSTRIEPQAGGSRRVVEGTVEIRLPVIGGRCEKIVVSEFQRSMEASAALAREMILERSEPSAQGAMGHPGVNEA